MPLCLAVTVGSGVFLLLILKVIEKCITRLLNYFKAERVKSQDEFYES